ncbi:hypothetical protein RJ641_016782 [Dillenia turbinata]|uniref:ELM2 domain-containing protein n=1 Tax=Dillenia turbinata TaxID=194707 RepID=A0AAN8YZX1_9MAGN
MNLKIISTTVTRFGSYYKCVPVAPGFQAEVPKWTGVPSESDSKWLGTKIWPPPVMPGIRFLIERERVGKGRQDQCGCPLQGSIDCVRFHVAERRKRLKLELGSTFQDWKFDQMGEEVAQTWTEEDQKKFSAIVGPNPLSIEKCFWSGIYKSFPRKSREELVSYYFNVFLLKRRRHQNRFAPNDINSDDDD